MSNWPKHKDGSRMSIGEMTPEQRRPILEAALRRTGPSRFHVDKMMEGAMDRMINAPQAKGDGE